MVSGTEIMTSESMSYAYAYAVDTYLLRSFIMPECIQKFILTIEFKLSVTQLVVHDCRPWTLPAYSGLQ